MNNMKEKYNEYLKDCYVISWLKDDKYKPNPYITFATLNTDEKIYNFCNSSIGIVYDIPFESIIGANDKDGATILEDISKKNDYTIYSFDKFVVNSYNKSGIIDPELLLQSNSYNELILNSSMITPVGVVYLSSFSYEEALEIANKMNVDLFFYEDLKIVKSR